MRLFVLLLGVLAIAVIALLGISSHSTDGMFPKERNAETIPKESEDSEVQILMKRHEERMLQADEAIASQPTPSDMSESREQLNPSGATVWPGNLRRGSFPLIQYAVKSMGSMNSTDLLRHERLNPQDRPVDVVAQRELEALVALINSQLDGVARNYRSIRMAEMLEQIHAGKVRGRESVPASKSKIRMIARVLAAKDGSTETETEIYERLVAKGTVTSVSTNGIQFGGRIYEHSSFEHLPSTDRCLEGIQYFAFDSIGRIGSWFVSQGLLGSSELLVILCSERPPTRLELARWQLR